MAVVDDTTTVYLLLSGILDAAKEIEKLDKKQAEAKAKVGRSSLALLATYRSVALGLW